MCTLVLTTAYKAYFELISVAKLSFYFIDSCLKQTSTN